MSAFADLMAISASQTRQSDATTQSLLAERQRKEETRKKEIAERDRKERELEAKLLRKRFDDERKDRERQQKLEEEHRRREHLVQRREAEQRNALLYGPKKVHTERVRTEPRVRRESSPGAVDPANALTREEKRERKKQNDLNRSFGSKSSRPSAFSRVPRMLRGGVIDSTGDALSNFKGSPGQSVKQRLAAMPNTLTKLNVNKRDTRTIDEILQDRAKQKESKILDGEQAREFHDWFKKDKDVKKTTSTQPSSPSSSRALTPNPVPAHVKSEAPSRDSPAPRHSLAKPYQGEPTGKGKLAVDVQRSVITKVSGKPSAAALASFSKFVGKDSASSTPLPRSPPYGTTSSLPVKKRPRSPSPPPRKRPSASSSSKNDLRSEIWKLFGKDRDRYVNEDVMSDDDDMEADPDELRREELRSARLAKREDEEALEEEKRHEEEKRRRKRERERDGRY